MKDQEFIKGRLTVILRNSKTNYTTKERANTFYRTPVGPKSCPRYSGNKNELENF